jgi:hypothetical protein
VGQSCSDISRLIVALALIVIKLDRRPSLTEEPFHDVYFAELQASGDSKNAWTTQVQQGVERIRDCGGLAQILGTW